MRIRTTRLKDGSRLFYVIKTYYDSNGKEHSVTVEKLGNEKDIQDKYGEDADTWAKKHVAELNREEAEKNADVIVKFQPSKFIEKDYRYTYNIGYLFLQKICYELKLDKICSDIEKKYSFNYSLFSILSTLIYGRILHPASKKSTFDFADSLLQVPKFDLHQVYRALDVIHKETDFIQSELYKNSFALGKRNTSVIYYDCTNFFFEIENPDTPGGLRQYAKSKENRPLPIVEMGMFIDSEGIPLAMCIHPGNTNEQVTLKPLERKILSDYGLSKFVFCADAGLSSAANRRYNSVQDRAFVVTQSLKKLKKELHDWALDPTGFKISNPADTFERKAIFNINDLDEEKYYNRIFYKERWVDRKSFEEKLIVTYSIKYANYQKKIREGQVERAQKAIDSGGKSSLAKKNANDYRRFIEKISVTDDGEVASKNVLSLNQNKVDEEAQYDGFYAVCSNLDDTVENIIKVNKYRWKIEECFRIMKSEFKARPVYLSRDERISAHFMTCYLSLVVYRYLEKELDYSYTTDNIISTLAGMNIRELPGEGYIPAYIRTDLTDDLHKAAGFRTDYSIMDKKRIKEILKSSQKRKKVAK